MKAPLFSAAIVSLLAVAGCQPVAPPTTERIIRIQIEGCEDATPLPVAATPPPTQAPTQAPTRVAVVTQNPVETPATIQPPVERTPAPAAMTPQELAEEYALKREGFLAKLADGKLSLLDLPNAGQPFRRSEDLVRAKSYDEALRNIEVALLDVQSVRLNEPFLSAKIERVDKRVDAARQTLTAAEKAKASELLGNANAAFLANNFRLANAHLYDLEKTLDRKTSAAPGKRPPAR